ncbi:unnamed protein product [Periconia digitata]|uniref:DUF6594 domain-containing protein n=1 Tax=Periconia digitata TaxID=1303443 RepID=A0A9W4UNX0_9PLEO|nr:unnamed protein product [Periconia digitata]
MSSTHSQSHVKKIEDYRAGYPRYTALLSAHVPFFLCRRFNRIRARVLLLKQNKLSELEEQLDQIDRDERRLLLLGSNRLDTNADRLSTLAEIDSSLADYGTLKCNISSICQIFAKIWRIPDEFVDRSHRMLSLDVAEARDIESLQNWLNGTGCITREETAYLSQSRELVRLAPSKDFALSRLEIWVEDALIRFYSKFRKSPQFDLSVDPNVYLYSGSLIKQVARALLLCLITFLLLMPVVICNITGSTSVRIFVIMISTILYLSILFSLTKSRTMELVLAGATYATVLIVFVSGQDDQPLLKAA